MIGIHIPYLSYRVSNTRSLTEDHYEINYTYEGKEVHLQILDTGGNEYYLDLMHQKVNPTMNDSFSSLVSLLFFLLSLFPVPLPDLCFYFLLLQWFKGVDGYIFVYGIDTRDSFEALEIFRTK